uniref:Uncharacterized protein n=1 Tax=Nelumbo nucifera TaxID=4432 RepID=A0A822XT10_NELNU|nr:TPA_asm: hypothetical protein HUJ06_023509 [Nelumbo nucifera]
MSPNHSDHYIPFCSPPPSPLSHDNPPPQLTPPQQPPPVTPPTPSPSPPVASPPLPPPPVTPTSTSHHPRFLHLL